MPLSPAPHIAWQRIADHVIVVDLRSGNSIALNTTAGFIWERLEEHPPDRIVDALAEAFDVDRQAAEADLGTFLSLLSSRGLIRLAEESR